MPHRQGKMPQTVIHPCSRGRRPTPLPKRRKASRFVGAAYGFAAAHLGLGTSAPCKAHTFQTVQAEFCALHRKMRRCGLAAEVSSDEAAFAEFLQTHCPQTDRETVQHLQDAVRRHSLRPIHAPPKPRRRYRPCAVNYAKKLCRRTV